MKKKLGKPIIAIIVIGILICGIYFMLTSEDGILEGLKVFLPMCISSCMLLSYCFSTREEVSLPDELLQDESFVEAYERSNTGWKMIATGLVMFFAPIVLLFIFKHVGGFIGTIFLLSVGIGILVGLAGIFVVSMAGKDLAKFGNTVVIEPQPENKISKAFAILGGASGLALLVLYLL